MLLPDSAILSAAIDWLGNGLWDLTWWQIVLYTLVTTHITIAAVTIFQHRTQTPVSYTHLTLPTILLV